jgi:nanoRNase/pAp phosphatase (c-di-AMP/oligoRNAs hydrolase)
MNLVMDHPFPKSTTLMEKCKRLWEVVSPEDNLGVLIDADPDAMASAMALKRMFWRKVRKTSIYHINAIQRGDNLAFVRLLKIDQKPLRRRKPKNITKWAIVDSQPHHHEQFMNQKFDIIIDHHPLGPLSEAVFVDIKQNYGANSTIMVEYLRAAKIRPSPKLATALFYGIKTDTNNFVRESTPNDVNAFRYLYKYANMNIIKKIESSEITVHTLSSYVKAMERLTFLNDIAFVYMGDIENPDMLVIIADFFMRLAEATWSIVSGVYDGKLIIILRNAGFKVNAGKIAQELFGSWGGSAGGHRSAARAEIPLEEIDKLVKGRSGLKKLVLKKLEELG